MTAFLQDVASSMIFQSALAPGTQTSSLIGSTIDMLSTDGPCFAVQQVGTFSADSLSGLIEESPDGSNWTAVDGDGFTQVTTGIQVEVIRFERKYRYLRYSATLDGDTPSVAVSVLLASGKKHS